MDKTPYEIFKELCVSERINFPDPDEAYNDFVHAYKKDGIVPHAWGEAIRENPHELSDMLINVPTDPKLKRVEAEGVGDNNGFYEVGMPSAPNPVEHSAEQHAFEQSPYGKQKKKEAEQLNSCKYEELNHIWTDMEMILDGTIDCIDRDNAESTQSMVERLAKKLGVEVSDTRPEADRPSQEL